MHQMLTQPLSMLKEAKSMLKRKKSILFKMQAKILSFTYQADCWRKLAIIFQNSFLPSPATFINSHTVLLALSSQCIPTISCEMHHSLIKVPSIMQDISYCLNSTPLLF